MLCNREVIKNLPTYKRRFINEIPEILDNNIEDINISFNTDNIILCLLYQNINIKININNNYPWKPPTIILNNTRYAKYICSNIKSHGGDFKCLCCLSVTCFNNWSPAIHLIRVLDEIKENIILKQNIIYLIYIKKIKKQYLVDDIPLEIYFKNLNT